MTSVREQNLTPGVAEPLTPSISTSRWQDSQGVQTTQKVRRPFLGASPFRRRRLPTASVLVGPPSLAAATTASSTATTPLVAFRDVVVAPTVILTTPRPEPTFTSYGLAKLEAVAGAAHVRPSAVRRRT